MAQPAANDNPWEGDVYFPSPDVVNGAHIKEYEQLYRY